MHRNRNAVVPYQESIFLAPSIKVTEIFGGKGGIFPGIRTICCLKPLPFFMPSDSVTRIILFIVASIPFHYKAKSFKRSVVMSFFYSRYVLCWSAFSPNIALVSIFPFFPLGDFSRSRQTSCCGVSASCKTIHWPSINAAWLTVIFSPVIHAKVLPGSVLYIDWITLSKGSLVIYIGFCAPDLKK